jgi:protocatechuate 3,4-dioxygenase beta subunit
MKVQLTRRQILESCLARGVLVTAAPLSISTLSAFAQGIAPERKPTPENELGPFYKKGSPERSMLRAPGDNGFPLKVMGHVMNTRGDALPEARVEVWQANHVGKYDVTGYGYRARLPLTAKGEYGFDSVMPGHYPDRVCQHIHYLVTAPGHKPLVTQLYFATDPVFEGNPDKNFGRDPLIQTRELVRPVTLFEKPGDIHAQVVFELCLERA